ncbi:MAG: TrmO family methyltransferase domain-containing protein [Candidatus Heimdallarchaeaceae archaeon]
MNKDQNKFQIYSIGSVRRLDNGVYIELDKKYAPAIKELNHFSHVQVLWWADKHDDEKSRNIMQTTPPYGENPPVTGVFATRAVYRPNPIGLTVAKV